VNAPVQAAPATHPVLSANLGQGSLDAASGVAGDPMPDGGFQGVLEQRLRSAGGTAEDAASPAAGDPATAPGPVDSAQLFDSERISGDGTAAFLALHAAPVPRTGGAAMLPGQGAAQGGGDPLLQALGRSSASGTARATSDGAGRDAGIAGAEGVDGALEAADLRAAMDAASGKRLPQAAADSPAASRALLADAAALRNGADASHPLQTGGPTVAEGGGVTTAGAQAPAAPTPGEARSATTQVATPFGRPEWSTAMNERVTWLVGQRVQSADIQLNPPQLGPVEVRITIQNDQASLFFSSQHAAVREAIQAALPRLNEMLAQGGLSLGQTSVGAESFAGQQQASRDGSGRGHPADAPGGLAAQVSGASGPGTLTVISGGVGIDMFV